MPARSRIVILLRGINVGGANRVPMAALRSLLAGLGFSEIETYIQSGNAVCIGEPRRASGRVSKAISVEFGLDVAVVVRTAAEIDDVIAQCPYDATSIPGKFLHVVFLDREPEPAAVALLDPDRSPPDEAKVVGRHVFVHYPDGSARSKLNIDYLERTLDVTATGRNWNTVRKLAEMAHRLG